MYFIVQTDTNNALAHVASHKDACAIRDAYQGAGCNVFIGQYLDGFLRLWGYNGIPYQQFREKTA